MTRVLEADTSAALRDAVEAARARLETTYLICPSHNPVGPFDFAGAYDQLSDRCHSLEELVERGYDDAGREFIGPILGASGEHLVDRARATAPPGPESQDDRNWA